MTATGIPSPPIEWSQIGIGGFTVYAYALFILAGIFFALWLTTRRWVERGGKAEVVAEVTFWAVPFGIVGGRIYHVISSPAAYFGEGGDPMRALRIWEGGLGIWGAVAFGVLGAYIGCRRHGVSFSAYIDSVAPAVLIAQAIGRLGNYFNHELYGAPTELPWGLQIDPSRMPFGAAEGTLYHPTFLYEMLWNLAGAALIIYLDRRWNLRGGRVFWLYVTVYTTGRLWIEYLRIDEAVMVAGLRINVWVSIVVLLGSLAAFLWLGKRQRATGALTEPPRNQLAATDDSDQEHGDDDGTGEATAADSATGQAATDAAAADEPAPVARPVKRPTPPRATRATKPGSTATAPRKPAAKKPPRDGPTKS